MSVSLILVEDAGQRAPWNACVTASPTGHFFQSWEWGDVQDGLGGSPRRIAVTSDGQVVACAQLLVFDSGTRKFAYVPRGPVVDPDDEDLVDVLLDAVVGVSRAEGADFVRLEPQWAFQEAMAERLVQRGFASARQHIMPPRTLLVDLCPAPADIWAGFRSNTRNRIRLAEKLGVGIRVGGADDMPVFVRLFEETTARHGLRLGRAEQFLLAQRFFDATTMRLFLARADDVDLAGIVVFLSGTTATYLWGASSGSESARRLNPNQLLHWTAMQWARDRGCTTYDMFGIPDFDADVLEAEYGQQTGGWWNLYRFKRGFGGTVHRHMGTFDMVFER